MSRYIVLLLFISLFACENTAEETQRFSEYFDVDSLFDAQLKHLDDNTLRITKAAELNNKTDTSSYPADVERLRLEFNVFRKANINKPAYSGVYEKTSYDSGNYQVVNYKPTKGTDNEVKELVLIFENDNLNSLKARVEENHWLYDSRRKIYVNFAQYNNENLIKRFTVEGTQKMILRDRVNFEITGTIVPL